MHEHGIADDILARLLEHMRQQRAARIVSACLTVGEMSGYEPEALAHALHHCAEHENLPPFHVDIQIKPTVLRCSACGQEASLDESSRCPKCDSTQVEVVPATGVTIRHIELAVE